MTFAPSRIKPVRKRAPAASMKVTSRRSRQTLSGVDKDSPQADFNSSIQSPTSLPSSLSARSLSADRVIFNMTNRFASCLLMPREMLKRAWHEWRDGMDPIFLPDLRAENGTNGTDEMLMENAVRPLAGKFQVSPEAMRIHAEGMSLLMRKREASLF